MNKYYDGHSLDCQTVDVNCQECTYIEKDQVACLNCTDGFSLSASKMSYHSKIHNWLGHILYHS